MFFLGNKRGMSFKMTSFHSWPLQDLILCAIHFLRNDAIQLFLENFANIFVILSSVRV